MRGPTPKQGPTPPKVPQQEVDLARSHAPSNRRLRNVKRFGAIVGLSAMAIGVLALPALAKTTVVVKRGDTLSGIARKAGLSSWRSIYDANASIVNPDLIFPGQTFVIPSKGDNVAARSLHSTARPVARHSSSHRATSHRSTWRPSTTRSTSHSATPSTSRSTSASSASSASFNGGAWDRIAACESGGNWSINTGNGFYGGLQFTLSSWRAVGGSGLPNQATKATQIAMAQRLQAAQGWGAWPVCSARR